MASNYNPSIAWKNANVKPIAPTYSPTLSWAAANNALTPTTAQTYLNTATSSSSTPFYPTPTGAPIPTTISAGGPPSVLGATTSFAPQIPTTISSKSIAPSSFGSLSLPPPPTASTTMSATPGASSFSLSSLLTPEMASYGYSVDPASGLLVQPKAEPAKETPKTPNKLSEMFSSLKDFMPKPLSTAEQYQELERQSGIREKQNIVNSITGQLNAVVAKQQQDLLTTRGTASQEGVTEAVYGGIAATINREAAIKTLPLAAQLSAANSDLQSAREYLSTYANLLINDSKSQYDYQVKMFDAIWDYSTKQEQNIIEEKKQEKANQFTTQRDNLAYARDLAGEALKSGQRTLAGQITTLMQNPNSPTFVSDLGAYAGQIMPKTTGDGVADYTSVPYYADLLATGKISLANVPQNIRNEVVTASQGIITKPLSDVAITKINDTNFAITSLNDLRTKIQTNISQLGPITGLEALNPWSKKRQLQADIDRVRQTVGKALEGGVLRKEDEEKYKKILATITDTPETALYKIDALISSIQRNIEDYKSLQSESGRFVPTKKGTTISGSAGTTSSGNSYTITKE